MLVEENVLALFNKRAIFWSKTKQTDSNTQLGLWESETFEKAMAEAVDFARKDGKR